jgi:hypothetical protein
LWDLAAESGAQVWSAIGDRWLDGGDVVARQVEKWRKHWVNGLWNLELPQTLACSQHQILDLFACFGLTESIGINQRNRHRTQSPLESELHQNRTIDQTYVRPKTRTYSE